MTKKFGRIKTKLGQSLDLPADCFPGTFRLEFAGGILSVYGCTKILEYTSEKIAFQTIEKKICVCGKSLECTSFTSSSVEIVGNIECISFV